MRASGAAQIAIVPLAQHRMANAPPALHIAVSLRLTGSSLSTTRREAPLHALSCKSLYLPAVLQLAMHVISRDHPCYYLTSVAKDRLPVFRSDAIKTVVCDALDEARNSGGFSLYGYVVMPDHLHIITDSVLKPSKTLQFVNGIISRRVIDYLKNERYETSLQKLEHAVGRRQRRYSLWDHHPDARLLLTEEMLMQRVNYTHLNPVRAGLADRPEDYRWSSARIWAGKALEDEPLLMNLDRIKWRRSAAP